MPDSATRTAASFRKISLQLLEEKKASKRKRAGGRERGVQAPYNVLQLNCTTQPSERVWKIQAYRCTLHTLPRYGVCTYTVSRGGRDRVATHSQANPAGGSVSQGSERRRSMPITRRTWGETPGRVRLRALTRSNCQYLDRTRNQI